MVRRLLLGVGLALLASGCVHAPSAVIPEAPGPISPAPNAPPLVRAGEPVGLQIADRADHYLEHGGSLIRRDCSGLVETIFDDLGLQLPAAEIDANAVAREYVALRREHALVRSPLPGDLAFFHDTYDRNHDGRVDDPLTHVAIVASVDTDGTVTLVHFGSHGIATFRMNLAEPARRHDSAGRTLNDYLRVRKRRDPRNTRYLAGELFYAFGRVPEIRARIARR